MLIYNITFHIDDAIHEKALLFLKENYIPKAESGGFLFNPRLCKVHNTANDSGHSYSIQFYVKNQSLLNEWWKEIGEKLHHDIAACFNNQVLGFTTILEELDTK